MSADSVEEKIIEAAIACIEEFGLSGATNRRIAERAGVNLAAINYYFRSKDNLIDKVMETTLNNAFDWTDIEQLPGRTAKERCTAIFDHLIKGGCDYPGITRAHFNDLFVTGNYNSLMTKKYNEFMSKLLDDLETRGAGLTREKLNLACTQIAQACLMSALAPQINTPATGIDMRDPETRWLFVSSLADKLLEN